MAMSSVFQHVTTKCPCLVSIILIMTTSAVLALYNVVALNTCCIVLRLYIALKQNDKERF